MKTQIIQKIIDTENQATQIIKNSQNESLDALAKARGFINQEFEEELNKKKQEHKELLCKYQKELEQKILDLQNQKVDSGIDQKTIDQIVQKIINLIAKKDL